MKVGFDTISLFTWQCVMCPVLVEIATRNGLYVKTLRVFGVRVAVWAGKL